jgi:hypothetical protein
MYLKVCDKMVEKHRLLVESASTKTKIRPKAELIRLLLSLPLQLGQFLVATKPGDWYVFCVNFGQTIFHCFSGHKILAAILRKLSQLWCRFEIFH